MKELGHYISFKSSNFIFFNDEVFQVFK